MFGVFSFTSAVTWRSGLGPSSRTPPRVVGGGADSSEGLGLDTTGRGAWGTRPGEGLQEGPGAFSAAPSLCLQGEPGPPGQTGPEGPGGQQGSPGTQGRTVQGPVVGVAPFLASLLSPLPVAPLCPRPAAQALFPLQGPPGIKGEKGDHGLPGLQVGSDNTRLVRRGVSGTRSPPLGQSWPQPGQCLCSLLGPPWPPGRPWEGWPPGTKGGREPRGEGLTMEAAGGVFSSVPAPP